MGLIADILLVAAAAGACFYCIVLSRRLRRFNDLEKGVGGAIAALSAQVEDMTRTLRTAQGAASESASSLGDLTGRAEHAARRLELLVAAMHDLPDAPPDKARDAVPDAPPTATAQATSDDAKGEAAAPALFASRRSRGGEAA